MKCHSKALDPRLTQLRELCAASGPRTQQTTPKPLRKLQGQDPEPAGGASYQTSQISEPYIPSTIANQPRTLDCLGPGLPKPYRLYAIERLLAKAGEPLGLKPLGPGQVPPDHRLALLGYMTSI